MAEKYYAMIDGEQKGPFALDDLPKEGVRPSTYIWCKGLPDWQKAEDNAEVCRLFRNHLYNLKGGANASGENTEKLKDPGAWQGNNGNVATGEDNPWRVRPDNEPGKPKPTRYDRWLEQAGEDPLPTLEEIDAKEDKSEPPVSMIGYAWLVTFFCCWPTGIVALVNAYRSKRAWKNKDNAGAHEYNRKAKMWTGISFFLGVIGWGLFLALSM